MNKQNPTRIAFKMPQNDHNFLHLTEIYVLSNQTTSVTVKVFQIVMVLLSKQCKLTNYLCLMYSLDLSVWTCLCLYLVQPHSWWWGYCWASGRDKTPLADGTGLRCMSAGPLSDEVFLLLQKTNASAQLMLPRSESPAGSSGSQTPCSGPHTHPCKANRCICGQ